MWFVAFTDNPETFINSAPGIRARRILQTWIMLTTILGLACAALSFVSAWFGYAYPLGWSIMMLFMRSSADAFQHEPHDEAAESKL